MLLEGVMFGMRGPGPSFLYLYHMSHWSYGVYNLTQGCFTGLLQHLGAHQSDSRKLHAEEGRSDAVQKALGKGGFSLFSGAIALCLPS